jgi:hypothetical protein
MTNDQAYAYTQFSLCKFVEGSVMTKETMLDMLDVIGESEIIERVSNR